MSRANVVNWTNGTTKHPRPEHLFAAAREMGVSAEWLATGKGPKPYWMESGQTKGSVSQYGACDNQDPREELHQLLSKMPYHVVLAVREFVKKLSEGSNAPPAH